MRLCSGHPKVHFGTIVVGSLGGGCTKGPAGACARETDRERGKAGDK